MHPDCCPLSYSRLIEDHPKHTREQARTCCVPQAQRWGPTSVSQTRPPEQPEAHVSQTPVCHAGDRYDGEFKDGQEDGVGIFSWADGATYEGFWKQGQKHGIGLYRPVSTDPRRSHAPQPDRPEGASAGASPLPRQDS